MHSTVRDGRWGAEGPRDVLGSARQDTQLQGCCLSFPNHKVQPAPLHKLIGIACKVPQPQRVAPVGTGP